MKVWIVTLYVIDDGSDGNPDGAITHFTKSRIIEGLERQEDIGVTKEVVVMEEVIR